MDLNDISSIYEKNLVEFFHNEKVMKIICNELYGKNYKKRKNEINGKESIISKIKNKMTKKNVKYKDDYNKEYKEILDNTVFVPYINLRHLETYINSYKNSALGDEYIEKNLKEESKLLRELTIKKQKITEQYTSFLLEKIKEEVPSLKGIEYNEILKKCSNIDFDENIKVINHAIYENNNGILFKNKAKKINRCIEKFKKITEDKILMETSSYFKHRNEMPADKNYLDILDYIRDDSQQVGIRIGENSDKNTRYVFLPVLEYENKEEYLKNAVHEMLHLVKGKVKKDSYMSGFRRFGLINKKDGVEGNKGKEKKNLITEMLFAFKWKKLIKENKIIQDNPSYNQSERTHEMEEIIHHFEARDIVQKIYENDLDKQLQMPYDNKSNAFSKMYEYEQFDVITQKFMRDFKEDIQDFNSDKISLEKLKSKLGKTNFEALSQLYCQWTYDVDQDFMKGTATKTDIPELTEYWGRLTPNYYEAENQEAYTQIGKNIVFNMETRRNKIMEKTKGISPNSVISNAARIEENRKTKEIIGFERG